MNLSVGPCIGTTELEAILWFKQQVAPLFPHSPWQETIAVCDFTLQEALSAFVITFTDSMYKCFSVIIANASRKISGFA